MGKNLKKSKQEREQRQAELFAKLDRLVAKLPEERKAVLLEEINKERMGDNGNTTGDCEDFSPETAGEFAQGIETSGH